MKTLELKLKKDVIIVEIPRLADYEFINKECKYLKVGNEEIKLNASTLDKFEFLCKGSELTEEMASELVKKTWIIDNKNLCKYKNYNPEGNGSYFSAVESFISAVESKEKFWLENPVQNTKPTDDISFYDSLEQKELAIKKWQEAEEKTFKNPLIFVKK
jgi:hypothetical protein